MRSLQDLVKGIRAHKKDETAYIAAAIAEIKEELRSPDKTRKTVAIQKVSYLFMLGHECEWAAFHVVEVMSDSRFANKRIGYLAASLLFTPKTDVMLLTTNLFKKDLASPQQFEVGIAINCLANICTPDLARDLCADIVTLLNNSRAYIRKKSVLVLYKIFLQYPDALRPAFPRLKEKLEDSDVSVISAAVNVLCELSMKNPKNYLPLAPHFFKLMSTIQSNWTLIKIVKLMGSLTPLEPRLAKKLVEPMTTLINTTPAKSLLFECIQTATTGMLDQVAVVRLAVEKLRTFVEDTDQNIKYLGLLGLCNVMGEYPRLLLDLRDTILGCLSDPDTSIRKRAIDLVCSMVTKKNLVDVVKKLQEYVPQDASLIAKIVSVCNGGNHTYPNVTDFEWYVQTLCGFLDAEGVSQYGALIANELVELCLRVPVVREDAVRTVLAAVIQKKSFWENLSPVQDAQLFSILGAAVWIVGEYTPDVLGIVPTEEEDEDEDEEALSGEERERRISKKRTFIQKVLNHLIAWSSQQASSILPTSVQTVFLQAALKVFAAWTQYVHVKMASPQSDTSKEKELVVAFADAFQKSSTNVDVQERCGIVLTFLSLTTAKPLYDLFREEMNPVAKGAQRKVAVPEGLDLTEEIGFSDDESDSDEDLDYDSDTYFFTGRAATNLAPNAVLPLATGQSLGNSGVALPNRAADPFYLKGGYQNSPIQVDNIPIETLEDDDGKKKKKKKKGKKEVMSDEDSDEARRKRKARKGKPVTIKRVDEAQEEEEEKKDTKKEKAFSALDVDLSAPLGDDEVLPTVAAYKMTTADDVRMEMERRKASKEERRKMRQSIRDQMHPPTPKKSSKHETKESPAEEKKEKKDKKDKKEKKDKGDKSDALLLDMGATPDKKQGKEEDGTKSVEKKKKKKSVVEEESGTPTPASPATSTPSTTASSSASASAAGSALPAAQPFPFAVRELGQDLFLKVSMQTGVVPADSRTLTVPFVFAQVDAKKKKTKTVQKLSHVKIEMSGSSTISFYPTPEFVLAAGETKSVPVSFTFKTCNKSIRASAKVSYKLHAVSAEGAQVDEDREMEFEVVFPLWLFLKPLEATIDAVQQEKEELTSVASGVIPIDPSKRDVNTALRELSGLLRAMFVHANEEAVVMNAISAKDQKVLVFVRQAPQGLKVELRTKEDKLSDNLLVEVSSYFESQ